MTLGFYATIVFLFNFSFIYLLEDSYSFKAIKRSAFFRIIRFTIRMTIWLLSILATQYIALNFLVKVNAIVIAPFIFIQIMIMVSLALSFVRRNGALLLRNNFSAIVLMANTLFLSSLLFSPGFIQSDFLLIAAVFITTFAMSSASLLSKSLKHRFIFDPPSKAWQGYPIIVLITALLVIICLPINYF